MSRRRRTEYNNFHDRNPEFKPTKLVPRTENQRKYIQALKNNDIVLCYGPAGSGKTHIAVGMAVQMLKRNHIERLILCRPIVDSGNSIGYLPGGIIEKVGPYLTPFFDELSYYVNHKHITKMMAEGTLEICPLTMMRGRTFNDCFVILDEAQNATMTEIRMFLTRIGANSKMVLAGDLRQSDLHARFRGRGGLETCVERLAEVEGIAAVELMACDIVRHHLISDIEECLEGSDGN